MKPIGNKRCCICGEKIGEAEGVGLKDGNICKACARRLSPYFEGNRRTAEEARRHLIYRIENEKRIAEFCPHISFAGSKTVYVDPFCETFIVTDNPEWRNDNPDIIKFSQVIGVDTAVNRNKREKFFIDSDGIKKSYNPRKFDCDYEFNVEIRIDSPWFDKIGLEIGDGNRPVNPVSNSYLYCEWQMRLLADILMRRDDRFRVWDGDGMMNKVRSSDDASPKPASATPTKGSGTWICRSCGNESRSKKFCENCGAIKPSEDAVCAGCGKTYVAEKKPKFCENCGKPMS